MLIGYFSHEIRTPLNSVIMGIQLLLRDITTTSREECLQLLERMRGAVFTAANILEDLKIYDSIASVARSFDGARSNQSFMIISYITQSVRDLRYLCADRDINLVVHVTNECGMIVDDAYMYGDVKKLLHIITRLVSNAIENSTSSSVVTVDLLLHDQSMYSIDENTHSKHLNATSIAAVIPSSSHTIQITVRDSGPKVSQVLAANISFLSFISVNYPLQ